MYFGVPEMSSTLRLYTRKSTGTRNNQNEEDNLFSVCFYRLCSQLRPKYTRLESLIGLNSHLCIQSIILFEPIRIVILFCNNALEGIY